MRHADDRFFDRELSWLAFNGRVLQEAADNRVPLIERLRFLAIFSSNLDEFFRVRVAALRTLVRLPKPDAERLRHNPRRTLSEIHRVVDRQQRAFGTIFRELLATLRAQGIFLHTKAGHPPAATAFIRSHFVDIVAPHLNPITFEQQIEPPFLKNGGLYLVVPLWPREELDITFTGDPLHGIVEIPSDHVSRFVHVHRDADVRHVMFLDDIVRLNLGTLFPAHDVGEAYAIKLTRDAELYIEDEYSGDLVEMIRKALGKRETGLPTRFLFDQRMPYPIASRLKRRLDLDDEDLIPGGYYHNFSDFFTFPTFGRRDLVFPPMPPLSHPSLGGHRGVFEAVSEGDILLHFPYQSFDPILDFLRQAADDPATRRISATLYRVASDSAVVGALIDAASAGKDVTVFVEVKARFDEKPNLDWADRMERAGIHVIYSHPGLKVHCKLVLVETATARFAYLGTGNLNENTARIYADHGMLTADRRITEEVERVFWVLQHPEETASFDHLLVAPISMRKRFRALIEREIDAARSGRTAGMVLKMNSLEDRGMIRLLYRAARAGVDVRLIIRGICCLAVDDGEGPTTLSARSIVGRFLEHARVYRFHNGGKEDVYLASADWMKRNLKRRIEIAWPVYDGRLKKEIADLLDLQLLDNTKARNLDASQSNPYVSADGRTPVDAQADTYAYLQKLAGGAGEIRA